jgi:hypothetical protein
MDLLSRCREARNVKLGFMGRMHGGAIQVASADGIGGKELVDEGGVGTE